jgi:hypothetical protein
MIIKAHAISHMEDKELNLDAYRQALYLIDSVLIRKMIRSRYHAIL